MLVSKVMGIETAQCCLVNFDGGELAYLTKKNLSVQRLTNDTSYYDKLSPNYDCLFYDALKPWGGATGLGLLALGLLYDDEDGDEHFTDEYNYYGYYTGYDFLELGRRLGLPEPLRSFIAKLKANQEKIVEIIDHSYIPGDMKALARATVKDRIQAMQLLGR